jgi:hypothetical protein
MKGKTFADLQSAIKALDVNIDLHTKNHDHPHKNTHKNTDYIIR